MERTRRIAAAVSGVTVSVMLGCSFSATMERSGPPGTPCPTVSEPSPDGETPDTTVLRWYRSADGRDQRLGGESCSEVSPPTFRGVGSGQFGAWRVGDSLTVLSWNSQGERGDVLELIDRELGLDCSAGRPARREGYPHFVLLLQDVARGAEGAASSDVVGVAERCGLALHYVASVPGEGGGDRGNAVLSTLELTTPIAIELPVEGGRRVSVAATIALPRGARMRVTSASIDGFSSFARALASGGQTRTRQVAGLIDGLEQAEDDGPLTGVLLVGGDFANWDDAETAIRLMRDAFAESPAWDGQNTSGPFSTDHIFFRRGSFLTVTVGSYERVENRYGSGHHARRVTVNYHPPTGG